MQFSSTMRMLSSRAHEARSPARVAFGAVALGEAKICRTPPAVEVLPCRRPRRSRCSSSRSTARCPMAAMVPATWLRRVKSAARHLPADHRWRAPAGGGRDLQRRLRGHGQLSRLGGHEAAEPSSTSAILVRLYGDAAPGAGQPHAGQRQRQHDHPRGSASAHRGEGYPPSTAAKSAGLRRIVGCANARRPLRGAARRRLRQRLRAGASQNGVAATAAEAAATSVAAPASRRDEGVGGPGAAP